MPLRGSSGWVLNRLCHLAPARSTLGSMTEAVAVPLQSEPPSKRRRLAKIAAWVVGLAALLRALHLAGVGVWGWRTPLWDTTPENSLPSTAPVCPLEALHDALPALCRPT